VLVYSGGHISGGHFNPSVTISVLLASRDPIGPKDVKKAAGYIALQLLGGLAGGFMSVWLTAADVTPAPSLNYSTGIAFLVEVFYSFFLQWVVLNTATTKSLAGNGFYGAAIGLTVFVGASSVGGISGGAFNPAVATGATLASFILPVASINDSSPGKGALNLFIYWCAHILASMVSSTLFRLANSREGYTWLPKWDSSLTSEKEIFSFKYLDLENEWVTFNTEEEFQQALVSYNKQTGFKIKVETKKPKHHHENKYHHHHGKHEEIKHNHHDRYEEIKHNQTNENKHHWERFFNRDCQRKREECPRNKEDWQQRQKECPRLTRLGPGISFFNQNPQFTISKENPSQREIIFPHIVCDGCQTTPIKGERWKCNDCEDFDFCGKCYQKVKHDKTHTFQKIGSIWDDLSIKCQKL